MTNIAIPQRNLRATSLVNGILTDKVHTQLDTWEGPFCVFFRRCFLTSAMLLTLTGCLPDNKDPGSPFSDAGKLTGSF